MTSRCASCHYPLTVIDSVSCYECSSHFHVDCGQTFGFPVFALSADPNKNKFHCTTCQILPLPFSRFESDSDLNECEMPSRHLDYQQDDQPDIFNGMNELKGSVQDLHELCKDMLREINEIKSINLTLRCCIENLRHDNEERDSIIVDLRRRIDLLEKRENVAVERNESTRWKAGGLYVEKEETTESITKTKYECTESVRPKNVRFHPKIPANNDEDNMFQEDNSDSAFWPNEEKYVEDTNKSDREETIESEEESPEWKTQQDDSQKNTFTKDSLQKGENDSDYSNDGAEKERQDVLQVDKTVNSEVISEIHSTRDWEWRGNEAVELKDAEKESDNEDEENEDPETEDVRNSIQSWSVSSEKGLNLRMELQVEKDSDDVIHSTNADEGAQETDEEDLGIQDDSKWEFEDVSEDEDEESEALVTQKEVFKVEVQACVSVKRGTEEKREETVEKIQEESEEDDNPHTDDADDEGSTTMEVEARPDTSYPLPERDLELGDLEGSSRLDAPEGDALTEGFSLDESRVEDRAERADHSLYAEEDGETRLEAEVPVEGFLRADGDNSSLGEQSPDQGEVQPSEPHLPEEPQHTEDDLWDYLRQTVKSVHPSTAQEFIENFIGTLKHVPEDLLKPVVSANIKRANTPSDTDGDHLKDSSPESNQQRDGETSLAEDSTFLGDQSEKDYFGEEHKIPNEEVSSEISEEPSKGYTALEGALFGGFWACWLIYSVWGNTLF